MTLKKLLYFAMIFMSKESFKMPTLANLIVKPKDTLKMGMSGDLVKFAQLELAKRGYNLKGTGYFGSATDTAVATFQKRNNLKADGELGPATAKAIDIAPLVGNIPIIKQEEISRPLWLEAGIKLIGTREGSGSSDNKAIINWAVSEGGDIAKEYTHDSIPWCALFANHILTKVGLKGTETLWALDFAGKWPSTRLAGPAVGAFAPMKRQGGGHIMVIVGRDQHGNVMGLGGNQSDAVTIAPFSVSRLNQGFYWPKGPSLPTYVGLRSLPLVTSSGKVSTNED
jgi:uncharacterized protein (TIGR02594 family)